MAMTRAGGGVPAALAHIERRYADRLTVARLARVAGLSRAHFIRAFHAAVGETPHRRLREKRLARAAELLATSPIAVSEIASQVGFESLGSFSRIFRARFGDSPTAYRARHRRRVYIPSCFIRMYCAGR
jgi:transcriptional regulator GlxA family with amidase domain